uniref:ubiquitinyl hydrolase 1 n=1 Tax=Monopterus albus TaxID=43700 RepID=A0A3Q3IA85_MONAL
MNAILQCLSNTELFAEYLALEQFRGGETTSNNEKAKSNGVLVQKKGSQQQEAGEVTEQLSGLVRALWTFEYTPQHSRDFKNVVSKSALQFRGNSQHDAQEFLLWLLDRVHEDLNHIVHPDSRPPRKVNSNVEHSYLFKRTEDEYIPDAESVRQVKEQHLQPQTCSLAQCFQLYTKEEQLAPDDAWRCPHCKQLQQGSIKLSLWTLPDILILHLKRFRQDGDRRMKMQNMVKFPLTSMDMDYLYDLYAVCNHHGTMQGGHYTGKGTSYTVSGKRNDPVIIIVFYFIVSCSSL